MSDEIKSEIQQDNMKEQNSQNDSGESTLGALEIDALKQEVEKYKNDYLYLRAEFETYKRNAIRERAEISKYGSERLVNEILSVVDNFDRALTTTVTAESLDNYCKGVTMTANELKNVLGRFGVTEVKCEGLAFDPSLHEAIGAEESESVPEGHISKVFRTAYKLHDRLVRPAQVVVAKAKSKI